VAARESVHSRRHRLVSLPSTSTTGRPIGHGDPGVDWLSPPGAAADGTEVEDLPPQMINGVLAAGWRRTVIIPAGSFGNDRDVKVVNERWYSEDLKVLPKSRVSDPRTGVSTYQLTNIVQGPPDPALFQPRIN